MQSATDTPDRVPFQAHVELLDTFLSHRDEIVERIQGVLNAKAKPVQYLTDRDRLAHLFEDCFFTRETVTREQSRLRGQLQATHWATGFKPREIPGMHNDLVDPAEMMRRAFHLWERTRWPGHSGRTQYAHTLFDLYLVRQLALLSMRVWDEDPARAGERLAQARVVLDRLWQTTPPDQPVLVRDAHWLIPLAQSPATDEVAPYFAVAERIAGSFSENDHIAIQNAAVRMAGGHLRSYLHYYITQKAIPLDDQRLALIARKSNALDFSVLIQGLVPLLGAYEQAVHSGNDAKRLALAEAICQGISPDPELFVNRVDLLGAYSMSEDLFTTTDRSEQAVYTPVGQRHVHLLQEYEARVGRVAKALYADCPRFRPEAGAYSPYGVLFGFSSNLLEHMALKSLVRGAITRFSLEDVFTDGDGEKLAWVDGWRRLPHVPEEVARLYAYPHAFAAQMFERVERALRKRATGEGDAVRTGRIVVAPADRAQLEPSAPAIPELPLRYVGSSDKQLVGANKAHLYAEAQLLRDRLEGHFVLSYETPGGWVAVSKDLLTEALEAGRDVEITGLPTVAAERLTLMCRGLVSR